MLFESLLATFANNILPVLLIAFAGWVAGHYLHIDKSAIGRSLLYFFSPALVFHLIVHSELELQQIGIVSGIAILVMLTGGGLAWALGLALRLPRSAIVALVLTATFANNGNYGLPLVTFAFGQQALAYASIYFVTSLIFTNTLGVIIASMGRADLRSALLGLLKVPTMYAVVLALIVRQTGFIMPIPLERAIETVQHGTVPLMLFLLGLELRAANGFSHPAAIGISAGIRLVVGPILGLITVAAFGVSGFARQAIVTEAGMPSAVFTVVLAREYNLDVNLVAATVLIGTLLSPLTLTPLLLYLGT
jgi:malate permease and related proteins